MEIEKYIDEDNLWDSRKILRDYDNGLGEPLYTAPPQREWQGLTDEETNTLIHKWAGELVFEVAQALKEKNNG